MAITVVLFDLDMTLLDTSALHLQRTLGQWPQVMGNLHQVVAFPTNPHLVPSQLQTVGLKVGVVTSSPRHYATQLLANFSVPFDVLVTGTDGLEAKPSPATLLHALQRLQLPPSEALYVGDDAKDVEASHRAGVVSIGAGWAKQLAQFARAAPDVLIDGPQVLLQLLQPQQLQVHRFTGEVPAGSAPAIHGGALLPFTEGVALGRYFTTSDMRAPGHELTTQLLQLKNSDAPAAALSTKLATGIWILERTWQPDYIVSVPPKPSQPRNRFTQLFQLTAAMWAGTSNALMGIFLADGLRAVKEVPNYKFLNPSQRRVAIAGAFSSNYTWRGAKVLLVDDVFTTGGTTDEGIRALKATGAGEVRVLTLGKDQDTFGTPCPRCGYGFLREVPKTNGTTFIGCNKWRRNDPSSCHYTRDAW